MEDMCRRMLIPGFTSVLKPLYYFFFKACYKIDFSMKLDLITFFNKCHTWVLKAPQSRKLKLTKI